MTTRKSGDFTLTDKQQEVWDLIQSGLTHREVGERLNLSVHTVLKYHKRARYLKESEELTEAARERYAKCR
jgi:DNA-binding CsgD family transcriptional regulator